VNIGHDYSKRYAVFYGRDGEDRPLGWILYVDKPTFDRFMENAVIDSPGYWWYFIHVE
jgi:hypothetical protein